NSFDESFKSFKRIENTSEMLSVATSDSELSDKTLIGMYDLKLPISYFGNKGIYTIYIKPKEITATIYDIGALVAYPDVRGIVIDIQKIPAQYTNLFQNNELVGYKIEYISNDQKQEYYRLVTSNNKCSPLSQNLTSTNSNVNGYRFNDSSTLSFLTVTPSSSVNFKPNALPFIGTVSQQIIISNTKFDPVSLEVELVEHDADTISYMLEGNQIRSLDKQLITTFNENNEIYKQQEFITLKDSYTGKDMFEVRRDMAGNIDFTQDFNDLFQR
ncbi:MAG: hypothetical protein EZS28_027276, partial [Streblomastix strix]